MGRQTRARKLMTLLAGSVCFLSVGLLSGTAYAYFTGSGRGTGSATAGAPSAVNLDAASGTTTSNLVPGGSADLSVTLDNPNTFAVTIVATAANGNAAGSGSCTVSTSGVAAANLTGLNISVPAGSGVTVDIPNGATMSTSSDSGCQGQTFHVPVTLTVER